MVVRLFAAARPGERDTPALGDKVLVYYLEHGPRLLASVGEIAAIDEAAGTCDVRLILDTANAPLIRRARRVSRHAVPRVTDPSETFPCWSPLLDRDPP